MGGSAGLLYDLLKRYKVKKKKKKGGRLCTWCQVLPFFEFTTCLFVICLCLFLVVVRCFYFLFFVGVCFLFLFFLFFWGCKAGFIYGIIWAGPWGPILESCHHLKTCIHGGRTYVMRGPILY